MAFLSKNSASTLVGVRMGNCRKATLLRAFDKLLIRIVNQIESGDRVVEVR